MFVCWSTVELPLISQCFLSKRRRGVLERVCLRSLEDVWVKMHLRLLHYKAKCVTLHSFVLFL